MSNFKCPRCKEFYDKYPLQADGLHHLGSQLLSPVRCAFDESGKFQSDNWNCQTMNRLRELCGEDGEEREDAWYWRNDIASSSIGVLPIPDVMDIETGGYVVMTWYKRKGNIGNAIIVRSNEESTPLTLEVAEVILRELGQ